MHQQKAHPIISNSLEKITFSSTGHGFRREVLPGSGRQELKLYEFIISIISAGVTTKLTFGKCFMLPVTKYASSFDNATS